MKITLEWLKRYIDTPLSIPDLCALLTKIGLEVEDVVEKQDVYAPFIIARVEAVNAHPNANRLQVCRVFDGTDYLEIVCGARNVRAGINVVLAPIGSAMPDGGHVIKGAEIRGIKSCGMLCSAEELALPKEVWSLDHQDIIELPTDVIVGQRFADYVGLNDTIIDIALTFNRRLDAASVWGIARDLAAAGGGMLLKPLVYHEISNVLKGDMPQFAINSNDCVEFCLSSIRGVNIALIRTNALYRQEILAPLTVIGDLHTNPLVNISNFCMFDLGRPNHIYDADKIQGTITVRESRAGEPFEALGGKHYELPAGLLVIADEAKILSLAGVIGGEASKVSDDTKNLLIEMACFSPQSVTKNARAIGITTDAQYRFEGGVDIGISTLAISKLVHTILDTGGGHISGFRKEGRLLPICKIDLEMPYVRAFSALEILHDDVISLLRELCFEEVFYNAQTNTISVTVPSHRMGAVSTPEDLIEEIIRLKGLEYFKTVGTEQAREALLDRRALVNDTLEASLIDKLLSRGLTEVITWSFIKKEVGEKFKCLPGESVSIHNPMTNEFTMMRSSLLPGLINVLYKNATRGQDNLALFEIGHVYGNSFKQLQQKMVAGLRSISDADHDMQKRQVDFFDAKGDVFACIALFGLSEFAAQEEERVELSREVPSYYHPGRSASIKWKGQIIAYCGELHPRLLKEFSLREEKIVAFELLMTLALQEQRYALQSRVKTLKFSPYQSVRRDFAFVVLDTIPAGQLVQDVYQAGHEFIQRVDIFDVYQGDNLPIGHKSVALRVTLQSSKATLTEQEITNVTACIIDRVARGSGGVLRCE